jgi:hypothetical protein
VPIRCQIDGARPGRRKNPVGRGTCGRFVANRTGGPCTHSAAMTHKPGAGLSARRNPLAARALLLVRTQLDGSQSRPAQGLSPDEGQPSRGFFFCAVAAVGSWRADAFLAANKEPSRPFYGQAGRVAYEASSPGNATNRRAGHPSAEAYCAATPTECVPFLGIAVSSITRTASRPPTSLSA